MKKLEKLSKLRKSKVKKYLSLKIWLLGKKLSKSRNSTNFNATKDRPKFLTFDARIAFNYL